jgi:hypothetical protein
VQPPATRLAFGLAVVDVDDVAAAWPVLVVDEAGGGAAVVVEAASVVVVAVAARAFGLWWPLEHPAAAVAAATSRAPQPGIADLRMPVATVPRWG